jgi:hypothetical protein
VSQRFAKQTGHMILGPILANAALRCLIDQKEPWESFGYWIHLIRLLHQFWSFKSLAIWGCLPSSNSTQLMKTAHVVRLFSLLNISKDI